MTTSSGTTPSGPGAADSGRDRPDPGLDAIMSERRQLINLTYRLLGSLAEAEDAVQETYTRWYALSRRQQDAIESPGAWLTTVASRICLDLLGSARARRENYVGEWIPEPLPDQAEWSSGRYQAVRPRVLAMDRATQADEIRQLTASPDVVMGSVAAVTETGSLVVASASGSQLPAYSGGAARAIWIVGAQKVVPDLSTALRRVEEHSLPLESARAQVAYGMPSAINRLLILNAEYLPGRGTVLLLREAIGF